MSRRGRLPLDLLVYLPIRTGLFLLCWLPEWIVYPSVHALGSLFFLLSSRRRGIALRNLRRALGEAHTDRELLRIGRRACGQVFKVAVDLARASRFLDPERFRRRVDLREFEEAKRRIRKLGGGRSAVFCSPHLGSWEAAAHAGSVCFGRLDIIARPLGNPFLERFVLRSRTRRNQHLHPRRGGIQAVRKGLEEGGQAVFLPDQNQRLRGVFVPFFGTPASCDRSPVSLSLMGGHPIVVAALMREGMGFRFKTRVAEIFLPDPKADRKESVYQGILRINRAMERLILERPEQYFWIHNRFRTRPPEEQVLDGATEDPTARRT